MERSILHADLNSFYASVECLMNPSLRGKPVAVGGDPESRHGIILTKNQIAKPYGIRVGQAIWEARQLCPELIVVPPHFDQYVRFSRQVRKIYEEYTDQVEPYGIDDIEEVRKLVQEVERLERVEVKTGEIFPTNRVPILLPGGSGGTPAAAAWGFPNPYRKGTIINARAETVGEMSSHESSTSSGVGAPSRESALSMASSSQGKYKNSVFPLYSARMKQSIFIVRRVISPEHRITVCILFPCAEHEAVLFTVGRRQHGISEGGKLSVIGDAVGFHLRCVFVESDIFPHRRNLFLNICNFTAVFIREVLVGVA